MPLNICGYVKRRWSALQLADLLKVSRVPTFEERVEDCKLLAGRLLTLADKRASHSFGFVQYEVINFARKTLWAVYHRIANTPASPCVTVAGQAAAVPILLG